MARTAMLFNVTKKRGEYKRQSKFKISSADQARKIIDALGRWVAETGQEQSCK